MHCVSFCLRCFTCLKNILYFSIKKKNMATAVKYIVDDDGHKTSVLVPVKTWEVINARYKKLSKKLAVLTGIRDGINEVKKSRETGETLQTLSDFLSESNS